MRLDLRSKAQVWEHCTYFPGDVMWQELFKKFLLVGNKYESEQVHADIKLATESTFQISPLKEITCELCYKANNDA